MQKRFETFWKVKKENKEIKEIFTIVSLHKNLNVS
jgi:hypothetical protein